MTDIEALEQLYAMPSADIGPSSAREKLLAAALVLRRRPEARPGDDWVTGYLMMWLADTAMLHAPDGSGHCERDGDPWPCFDVQAAQKVAETIGYEPN